MNEDQTKTCSKCGLPRTTDLFYPSKRGIFGVNATCRICKQEYNANRKEKRTVAMRQWRKNNPRSSYNNSLKKKYGITPEDHAELLTTCGSGCMICGLSEPTVRLCVDHDHDTGRVRGILCSVHNTALGLLGDKSEMVRKLLIYTELHEERNNGHYGKQ